jgi:hypothetical protein
VWLSQQRKNGCGSVALRSRIYTIGYFGSVFFSALDTEVDRGRTLVNMCNYLFSKCCSDGFHCGRRDESPGSFLCELIAKRMLA